jgi:hypothetical protein
MFVCMIAVAAGAFLALEVECIAELQLLDALNLVVGNRFIDSIDALTKAISTHSLARRVRWLELEQ